MATDRRMRRALVHVAESQRVFTAKSLAREVKGPVQHAEAFIREGLSEGSLEHANRPGGEVWYAIKGGAPKPGDPDEKARRLDAIWTAARTLKTFGVPELTFGLRGFGVGRDDVEDYIGELRACGYVRPISNASEKAPIYRLIRDTGPRAPSRMRVRALYDPNLGALTHVSGFGAVEVQA